MKISTKVECGIMVLIDICVSSSGESVTVANIAARQNLSAKYLEQIVALLNRPEILKTIRGAQGGYMLARAPEAYTVAEILKIAEGSLAPIPNLDDPSEAAAAADAQLLPIWQGLYSVVNDYLEGITLQDILDRQMESYDYSI